MFKITTLNGITYYVDSLNSNDIANVTASSMGVVFGLGGNDSINSAGGNNFIYTGDFTTQYMTGLANISINGGSSTNYNYINLEAALDVITISGNARI